MTDPIKIVAEAVRGLPLRQADIDALKAEGVPAPAMTTDQDGWINPLGRDRVVLADGRFEFGRHSRCPDAVWAYTWRLRDVDGGVADIAAWHPDRGLGLWLSTVGLVGEEQVFAPRIADDVLFVHPDVLSWLRAGRAGVVVADVGRTLPVLHGGAPLAVTDMHHKRRLEAMLTVAAPRIEVREELPTMRSPVSLEAAE